MSAFEQKSFIDCNVEEIKLPRERMKEKDTQAKRESSNRKTFQQSFLIYLPEDVYKFP